MTIFSVVLFKEFSQRT